MVSGTARFSIEEAFRQLGAEEVRSEVPSRPEFKDPLIVSFQSVPLSRLIDQELDRFYNPGSNGPVELISRMFRRLRRA
jgi:hypothetical protein